MSTLLQPACRICWQVSAAVRSISAAMFAVRADALNRDQVRQIADDAFVILFQPVERHHGVPSVR